MTLSSSIYFGTIADTLAKWLEGKTYTSIFVLTDTNTHLHCLPHFRKCTALTEVKVLGIIAGEENKNITACTLVWQTLHNMQADRKSLLVLLGGGVVGDLGGFCAATYMRGIHFVQVPTTLLAMTDASVGGKTGVDLHNIKNIIGAFAQPQAVFIDTHFLATLPSKEWKSGFAEVIKHAFIGDKDLLEQLLRIKNLPKAPWETLLPLSVQVKTEIVRQDPYEKNLRKLLNFGHTIGHALESHLLNHEKPLTHGECVAFGMLHEYALAMLYIKNPEQMTYHAARYKILKKLISTHYTLPKLSKADLESIWNLMKYDKKNEKGKITCVIPGTEPYTMQQFFPKKSDFHSQLSEHIV